MSEYNDTYFVTPNIRHSERSEEIQLRDFPIFWIFRVAQDDFLIFSYILIISCNSTCRRLFLRMFSPFFIEISALRVRRYCSC